MFITQGNTGFWAAHFWEGSTSVNGGSSFTYRSSPDTVKVRSDSDSQKIAIDILTQATPADQIGNRENFVSLTDLQNGKNPFSKENGGGDIYIITKATGYVFHLNCRKSFDIIN